MKGNLFYYSGKFYVAVNNGEYKVEIDIEPVMSEKVAKILGFVDDESQKVSNDLQEENNKLRQINQDLISAITKAQISLSSVVSMSVQG